MIRALTPEQLAFLRFHAETPAPHRWVSKHPPRRPATVTAWRYTQGRWQARCIITRAGLDGIAECFDSQGRLNLLGSLAATGEPLEIGLDLVRAA